MKRNRLAAAIVEQGLTQKDVAKMLGISPKTFYEKMKKGVFGTDEVVKMVEILKLKDPVDIFLRDE